ncbi:uncharacterized protein LOC131051112 [Cryptomeria japonica]|uniref:uncharacterized protein LOC131051112 n=1 Tax=Cryptomeria japonica TaxID=3369 RepID=UPI0025AD4397|nr:uncharacterized protein LOC131051112 [Cryptomeria japonica]
METYYDGFCSGFDLSGSIHSSLTTSEDILYYDVHQMGLVDDMQYEFPPLHDISQYTQNLNSSEDLLTVESVNSRSNPQHSGHAQSAFITYRKSSSDGDRGSFKTGQTLHKRCFALLNKIHDKRKLARQISSSSAPPQAQVLHKKKKRSAAEHMIAERGRRIRSKQHFSNLQSLLPISLKNNRNASRNFILASITSYLKELKLRVAQLEQQNQISQASMPTNISVESHEQSFNPESTVIYRSNEVTLEQCKENPCLVNIKTTMQSDQLACPTSVLMKQLEQLRREEVEIHSIHSNTEPFQFRSNILVTPKEQTWNIYMWQNLGNKVRETLF